MSHSWANLNTRYSFAIIVFMLACLAAASVSATDLMPRRRGYRVGLSFTDWRGLSANDKDVSFAPGGTVGAYGSFHVNEELVFQPELNLSMRRTALKYDYYVGAGSLKFDETASLYYIEIPLLVKLPFIWNDRSICSAYIGPVWAISLGGHRSGKYTSNIDNIPPDSYSGRIGNAERIDFGAAIGWDYHFGTPDKGYVIDLRYTLGLKSAFADVDNPSAVPNNQFPFFNPVSGQAEEYKSGTFMLSFGVDTPW